MFRSLIHMEVTFLYVIRQKVYFFHVSSNSPSTISTLWWQSWEVQRGGGTCPRWRGDSMVGSWQGTHCLTSQPGMPDQPSYCAVLICLGLLSTILIQRCKHLVIRLLKVEILSFPPITFMYLTQSWVSARHLEGPCRINKSLNSIDWFQNNQSF